MHFIPLAEGVEAVSLATLPEGEFTETVRQCKDAEAQRVYQVSSDVIKRQIGDEWILMPTGALAQRFNGMVSLSEVGDFIWEQLQEPKTLNQILEAAHAEFEDVGHMLDIETRKFISDYAFMGFLEELK